MNKFDLKNSVHLLHLLDKDEKKNCAQEIQQFKVPKLTLPPTGPHLGLKSLPAGTPFKTVLWESEICILSNKTLKDNDFHFNILHVPIYFIFHDSSRKWHRFSSHLFAQIFSIYRALLQIFRLLCLWNADL